MSIKPIGFSPIKFGSTDFGYNGLSASPIPPDPEIVGNTLDDDFHRESLGSTYTTVIPNSSLSIVSDELVWTKDNATATNGNYFYLNTSLRGLNNPYCEMYYRVPAAFTASSTPGAGPGFRHQTGVTGAARSVWATVNTNTDGGFFGRVRILRESGGTATPVATSAAFPLLEVNDLLRIRIEFINQTATATAWNLTKGTSISTSFTFGSTGTNNMMTNYYPAWQNRGGSIVLTRIIEGTNDYRYAKVLNFSDGVGQIQQATNYNNSIQNQLNIALGGTNGQLDLLTKYAIPSSLTQFVVDSLPHAINVMQSNYYFIMLGANDVEFLSGSIPSREDTAVANIETIVAAVYAAGKKPIVATPPAVRDQNLTGLATKILNHFDGDPRLHVPVINIFTMSYISAEQPFLKPEFEAVGSNAKLNNFASSWLPDEDENHTICNKIGKNWNIV